MKKEKPRHDLPRIGLIAFICAFVIYEVGGSILERRFVTPLEGKGGGLIVIILLYLAFRTVLTIGSWVWRRLKKVSAGSG